MSETTEARQNLGLLCFYPSRALEARLMEELAAAGFDDLTIARVDFPELARRHATGAEPLVRPHG